MPDDTKQIILRESTRIINSTTLLKEDVETLSDETALLAWSVLDLLEKELIKARKEDLRVSLFNRAESQGEKTDKGSYIYILKGGGKITKECRKGKVSVDISKLRQLLVSKGIEENRAIMEVPTVNEKGLEVLISSGEITLEELKKISTVGEPTFALKVTKPAVVTGLLKGKSR